MAPKPTLPNAAPRPGTQTAPATRMSAGSGTGLRRYGPQRRHEQQRRERDQRRRQRDRGEAALA